MLAGDACPPKASLKPIIALFAALLLASIGVVLATALIAADKPAAPGMTYASPGSTTAPANRITVLTPTHGASVNGDTKVELVAPGLAQIEATCWKNGGEYGADSKVTTEPVKLDKNYAWFVFSADQYPHGPITLKIRGDRSDGTRADNYYLQLFNEGGVRAKAGLKDVPVPPQAAGMTLTYSDDFDKMPTISRTGAGGDLLLAQARRRRIRRRDFRRSRWPVRSVLPG